MATKTARKKFRPPLKTCRSEQEGPSLPCSQASSTTTSGLPGTSQQERVGNAEQDSQSWLSQLTAAAVSTKPKDASPAVNTVSQDYAATAQSNKASSSCSTKAGLDDSLSGSERRMEGLASPASDPNCTLTHTMLSYCSESGTVAGNFGAAKRLNKYEVSLDFPESGNSAALDKCSPASHKFENAMSREKAGNGFLLGLFSVESEEEMMALDEDVMTNHDQLRALSPSRFQRKNKTTTRRYDYSTMLPKLGAQRTTTKKQKKNSKAKSVRLVVKQGLVSQVSSAVCCASKDTGQTNKADLSVYDYQPTPQKEHKDQSLAGEREVTFDLNNSNWISRKTREEQLAVDREVLQTIVKIREDIRLIREMYASKKAKKANLQKSSSTTLPTCTFKTPRQQIRRSRRVKPSLVMRESCHSSMHKGSYNGMGQDYYHSYNAALEKEE